MSSKNFGTDKDKAFEYTLTMNNAKNNTIAQMFCYGDKYKVVVRDVLGNDEDVVRASRTYLRNRFYDISNDIDKLLVIKKHLATASWSENLEYLVDIAKYLQSAHHFISPSHVVNFFEDPLSFEEHITIMVDSYLKDYDEEYNKLED